MPHFTASASSNRLLLGLPHLTGDVRFASTQIAACERIMEFAESTAARYVKVLSDQEPCSPVADV
jgi:hypothetical protein